MNYREPFHADELIRNFIKAWVIAEFPQLLLNTQIKISAIKSNPSSEDATAETIPMYVEFHKFLIFLRDNNIDTKDVKDIDDFTIDIMSSFRVDEIFTEDLNTLTPQRKSKTRINDYVILASTESLLREESIKFMNDQLNKEFKAGWKKIIDPKEKDIVRAMDGRMFEDLKIRWLEPNGEKSLVRFLIQLHEHENPRFIEKVFDRDNGFIFDFIRDKFEIVHNPNPTTTQFTDAARKAPSKNLIPFLKFIDDILRTMTSIETER